MGKYTVITVKDQNWEYRCKYCGQLRFCPSEEKPMKCENCSSSDILIARPGELPVKTIAVKPDFVSLARESADNHSNFGRE